MYDEHLKLKASVIDFGGWLMPVQYTNVIDEHNTTRNNAGLFDICHMGEFFIKGKDAAKFLQFMVTNDVNKLSDGMAQYACLCNENGGVVDDCFVYKFNKEFFMMVVNGSTIEKDFSWLQRHSENFEVELENKSDDIAKLDIQGPNSEKILQRLTKFNLSNLKRFHFVQNKVNNVDTIISRTGYTAEDGFEIYFHPSKAVEMWNKLLSVGKEEGIKPIGLGARDTLRIEACYSLYGHELSDTITPVEGGISWVVREKEEDYIGKDILLKQKKEGTEKLHVAVEVDKGIPREHYPVFKDNVEIGHVSSGSFSPTFRKSIAMAFVDKEYSNLGETIQIKIRDRFYDGEIVKKPFYSFRQGGK